MIWHKSVDLLSGMIFQTRRWSLSLVLLLCAAAGESWAMESGTQQPVLLPMIDLLKRLADGQDWQLMPWDQYHDLSIKAHTATRLHGSWIESADVTGIIGDDRRLQMHGVLTVVSDGPGQKCPIFASAPLFRGMSTIDGNEALTALQCSPPTSDERQPALTEKVVYLAMAQSGRHIVVLDWASVAPEVGGALSTPLPLAAVLSFRLRSSVAGRLNCDDLRQQQDGSYHLVHHVSALSMTWAPGERRNGSSIFGMIQNVTITVKDGQRHFHWQGRWDVRQGLTPTTLNVTFPPGWLALFAADGATSISIHGQEVEVHCSENPLVSCFGLLAGDAAIALPSVHESLWQSGEVAIVSDQPEDITIPKGWKVIPAANSTETNLHFAVPGPDSGAQLIDAALPHAISSECRAWALLGPDQWRLEQDVTIRPGKDHYSLQIQLPKSWKIESLTAPFASSVPDLTSIIPGSIVTLDIPHGSTVDTVWSIHVNLIVPSRQLDSLDLARIPDATKQSTRLKVVSGPGQILHVEPAAPWQTTALANLINAPDIPDAETMVELVAASAVTPIPLAVEKRLLNVSAETVTEIIPSGSGFWCRIEIRLAVANGEVQDLLIQAPWSSQQGLQASSPWAITAFHLGDSLILHSPEPWHGVRLLRMEGLLLSQSGVLPTISIKRGDGVSIALQQFLIVSQSGSDEILVRPGPSAHPIDSDDIPDWAVAIPGSTIVGTFRIMGSAAGIIERLDRPLASVPIGFIDQLSLRTQIDRDRACTAFTALVVSPGSSVLPIDLRPGQQIVAATIDGRTASVHHDGNAVTIALPGRTQVQLAVLISEFIDPEHVVIHAPRFGELPITQSRWLVAVTGNPVVRTSRANGAMPLRCHFPLEHTWYGRLEVVQESDLATEAPQTSVVQDQRQLRQSLVQIEPRGQPILQLNGVMLSGERIGVADVHLQVFSLHRCREWYLIALISGTIVGLMLGYRMRPRYGFIMALLLSLIGVAVGWFSETSFVSSGFDIVALGVGISIIFKSSIYLFRKFSSWTQIPSILIFAGACIILSPTSHAVDTTDNRAVVPTVLLMGYHHLDSHQLPRGVMVALTQSQVDILTQQASTDAHEGGWALACGPLQYQVRSIGNHLQGSVSFPVIVTAANWQTLQLDVGDSEISAVTTLPLTTSANMQGVTWAMQDRHLVINFEGHQQIRLTINLAWPQLAADHNWSLKVPGSVSGGTISLDLPSSWALHMDSSMLPPSSASNGSNHWILPLPLAGGIAVLSANTDEGIASGNLQVMHATAVRMSSGHLEWEDTMTVTTHGPLRQLIERVPSQLTVTSVAGDGIIEWSQNHEVLTIRWSTPRAIGTELTIKTSGVIPRLDLSGSALLLPTIPHAQEHGRLVLTDNSDDHFERPAELERSPSGTGEDIAATWNDPPTEAMSIVHWHRVSTDLRMRERVAIVVGSDRIRLMLQLALSGSGHLGQIRLAVPAEWTLESSHRDTDDAIDHDLVAEHQVFIVQDENKTELVLRPSESLSNADVYDIYLSMARTSDDRPILVPDFKLMSGLPIVTLQTVVVGDCGDPRTEADMDGRSGDGGVSALADSDGAIPPGIQLRSDERWRFTWQRQGALDLRLLLRHDPAILQLTAHHYMLVDGQGLRWSMLVEATPQQGTIQEIHLLLPDQVILRDVQARDLGWWHLDHRKLSIHFAGASRTPVRCALEMFIPWHDNELQVEAVTSDDLQRFGIQQLGMAVSDDEPLVTSSADGLARMDHGVPILPNGIDGTQLTDSYQSTRSEWKLTLEQGTWREPSGADGVVTLVDLHTLIAPDGETRSQARWYLLNRSRRQISIKIPSGVELWQVMVDGIAVTPRQDQKFGDLQWIAVPLGRTGEAATTIDMVWRHSGTGTWSASIIPPMLQDVQIMKSLWMIAAPSSSRLRIEDSSLQVCAESAAVILRTQSLIAEMQRLRSLSGLNARALNRLSAELQRIDAELDDDQVMLERLTANQAKSQIEETQRQALGDIQHTRYLAQDELRRLDAEGTLRSHRRDVLGFDRPVLRWPDGESSSPLTVIDGPVWSYLNMPSPSEIPWHQAGYESLPNLGEGQPAPGVRSALAEALMGVDLLTQAGTVDQITLCGAGADLRVSVSVRPTDARPWLLTLSALVLGIVSAVLLLIFGRSRPQVVVQR